jgi:hypothetical protein
MVIVDVRIQLARTLRVHRGTVSLARCLSRTLLGLSALAPRPSGALVRAGLCSLCGELTVARLVALLSCARAELLVASLAHTR